MARTATDIVNAALYIMGDKVTPVTGSAPLFDDSAAGIAASFLYTPTVQSVARTFEWDFSRREAALALSGGPAALGFALEYLYPANGIEVWQIRPNVVPDPYDPLPYNFTVGNTLIASVQKKVIWTDVADALAIYNNQPTEDLWDSGFVDAVERRLASLFSMALAGRPDSMEAIQASSIAALQIAASRDG